MSEQSFPPYADYRGQRLLLLEVKEQPEIAGHPTRLGYGYPSQGYHPDRIIYYRWDFGNGVDWGLTWAKPEESASGEPLRISQNQKAKSRKLKKVLDAAPEPTGRAKLDLSSFIRPFQATVTEGDKKK